MVNSSKANYSTNQSNMLEQKAKNLQTLEPDFGRVCKTASFRMVNQTDIAEPVTLAKYIWIRQFIMRNITLAI